MSSVRDRLRRQHEQPEELAPARPRSTLVVPAAPTASTRERVNAVEFAAADEEVLPKLGPGAGGRTTTPSFNTGVRCRLTAQRDREEERTTPPSRQAVIEYYAAEHDREEAEKREREEQARRDQEALAARQKQIQANNARALALAVSLDSVNASPEERRRIFALPAAKTATPEKLVAILLELRSCGAKPDWAK